MTSHTVVAMAGTTNDTTSRRTLVTQIVLALLLAFSFLGGMAAVENNDAGANGEIGYIATEGAPLMVHPTNLAVIDWMASGTAVDILWGPHEGMYEVRYYGTDGWMWAGDLSLNGAPAVGASSGGPIAAPVSAEHWIDVNRSSGLVSLMVGDAPQAQFWASMGWDQSADGFYSTAVGTYYIYHFDYSNHYTPFADAYISHWVGFDANRYNGFHSYTKDVYGNVVPGGDGFTGGCVALAPGDIDALFEFAQIGMRVEVHF